MKNFLILKRFSPLAVTHLIVWMSVAVVVQKLAAPSLAVVTLGLLWVAYRLHDQRLFTLLRRTRWIFLSLLIIYAFLTPGEPLWLLPSFPIATIEGLEEGGMQLGRLLSVLAGLSILLTLLSREQLIGGIYSLIYPARYLGISREKIAVRLALTLHYAESAMRDTAQDWHASIRSAFAATHSAEGRITIPTQPKNWIDAVLIVLSVVLILGAWK